MDARGGAGGGVVDLNADLGESFGRWTLGEDAAMVRLVTSANVACGFHAGDPQVLLQTCRDAVAHGVVIGAQVGYRDLPGFGRRFIDVAPDELYADVLYQIGALDGLARSVGGVVAYVKPHGALYNAVVHHEQQAAAVIAAVRDHPGALPVLGLPGSVLLALAEDAGLRAVREAFVDRGYRADGTLVSRRDAGALLAPDAALRQALSIASSGTVTAIDGTQVRVDAESLCVHGDSPDAARLAAAVRQQLAVAEITVRAFV
ncbi:5-oxoprolinase subunit PxpA [Flexivirga lutea]